MWLSILVKKGEGVVVAVADVVSSLKGSPKADGKHGYVKEFAQFKNVDFKHTRKSDS